MGNIATLYNHPEILYYAPNVASASTVTAFTPQHGGKIRLLSWHVTVTTAGTIQFVSATAGAISGAMSMAASIGYGQAADFGLMETVAGEALQVTLGGAGANLRGYLVAIEVY
jgi:hypothetical protein